MQALRIRDIGLSADASHAFHSMLKVIDGRASARWQLSDLAQADVLIAHASCDTAQLGLGDKPVVVVIDDRGSWPPAPFVLRHPFRVMQLLAMLDDVAGHLRAPHARGAADGTAWLATESLRALMGSSASPDWHVAQGQGGDCVWIGDGHAHAPADTVARLRAGTLGLGAFEATPARAPADARRLPLCDLAWFVGLHGPGEAAPWLPPDAAFRLRRWPDFGRLGAPTPQIELAALVASGACTAAALVERSGHAAASVHRFLAAASLAGLLAVQPREAEAPATAPRVGPGGSWLRFVDGLRRHLGRVA